MRRALAAMLGLAAAAGLAGSAAATAAHASPAAAPAADRLARSAISARQVPAAAASAPGAHTEHFRVISISAATRSSVLATGVFTAGGYQVSGQVTNLRASDSVVFPNGSLTVRRHITSQVLPLPTSACEITETIKGTLTLGRGTGAYRGLTGTGAFVQHITGVLPRSRGLCGGPMTAYQSITYEGATIQG